MRGPCHYWDVRLFVPNKVSRTHTHIAAQHHRKLGFKSELGGRSRVKARIMQRISMVALRATARQVIRGVALVLCYQVICGTMREVMPGVVALTAAARGGGGAAV